MTIRWWTAGLLLGAACASGSPAGRSPTPAPGTPTEVRPSIDSVRTEPPPRTPVRYPRSGGGILRYALERRDSVNATMPSGESQLQVLGRVAYVTLTWVATDTATRVTAVVDSIRADSGVLISLGLLDSARGARWTGSRDPQGRLRFDPTAVPPSLAAAQVQDELLLLFPPLPPEGVLAGSRWTDSTTGPARVSAFGATEVARVDGAADPTTLAGAALALTLTRQRTAAGEGNQFGQTIAVTATGSDTLGYQLAADGKVLAVAGQRWTDLVVSLPAIGQRVPARETSRLRFTLLR